MDSGVTDAYDVPALWGMMPIREAIDEMKRIVVESRQHADAFDPDRQKDPESENNPDHDDQNRRTDQRVSRLASESDDVKPMSSCCWRFSLG